MSLTLFKFNDVGTQLVLDAYIRHSCLCVNILLSVIEIYSIVCATS